MGDAALTGACNAAMDALRRSRDAHLRIVRSISLVRRLAEHPPPLLLLPRCARVSWVLGLGLEIWRSSEGTGGAGFVA
jgi:hypothetical protein